MSTDSHIARTASQVNDPVNPIVAGARAMHDDYWRATGFTWDDCDQTRKECAIRAFEAGLAAWALNLPFSVAAGHVQRYVFGIALPRPPETGEVL